MARGPTHPAATAAEPRLRQAGIALTREGEPTYVPLRPEGAEWSMAADGPSKRGYAKALAAELQRRVWPQATLLCCSGKRDEGEVNPRWALRLIPAAGGRLQLRHSIGQILSCSPWSCTTASSGVRSPGHGRRSQVLTLEQGRSGWGVFLPPLGRAPLEQLLGAIAAAREPWSELERREQAGAAVGLCSWKSVRPASQAPPPGEGSATMLDLQLAHAVLERLQNGDQRQAISETLCHLHADRSGNTHRSEISLDKFWNPVWPGGCQELIEFRAIESRPHHQWSSAVALLWQALAAHLLDPERRPAELRFWGEEPHDRTMLPSQLSTDLMAVLDGLAGAGPVAHPTAAALHGGPALARQSGPVQHQWCG